MKIGFIVKYALKDLFLKQKLRTAFGIIGIAISIFLLSVVSFATDSVSAGFVDYLTTEAGNQDITIDIRHHDGEPAEHVNTDYFEYKDMSNEIINNVDGIEYLIPRSRFTGGVNGLEYNSSTYWNDSRVVICSMNISREDEIGYGSFQKTEERFDPSFGLPDGQCMISSYLADQLFYGFAHEGKGDIDFSRWIGKDIQVNLTSLSNDDNNLILNLTINSTYTANLKYPIEGLLGSNDEEPNIIVDEGWWNSMAGGIETNWKYGNQVADYFVGKCSKLVVLIKDPETIYDIRDIEGAEKKIIEIGEEIITVIGYEDWSLNYPKLELLFLSEFLAMMMDLIFMFITFLAMLISGILINGILTTSVEERIREYGVNRVLGARRTYNVKMILMQGSLIAFFGSTLGILLAVGIVKELALPLIQNLLYDRNIFTEIYFVARPTTILISYAIGVGVSMFVSIFPAIRVMRMTIVDSINPYRHSENIFKLKQKSGLNKRLIFIGAILSFNGIFIYYLVPQALLTLNIGMLMSLLLISLFLFLIGVSLLAIGFMPLLIRIFTKMFEPFARKYIHIAKTNIERHQRRNKSTIVTLIIAFSFIIFTTSTVEIITSQVTDLVQFSRGSDIQVGVDSDDHSIYTPTAGLENQLMEVDGIEKTSAILATTSDLERIYDNKKQFDVTLGDYIDLQSYNIHLYGLDENYKDVVYDTKLMNFKEGSIKNSFDLVFDKDTDDVNIIISASLSTAMNLHVGDQSRLTFYLGEDVKEKIANIVGVAAALPGLNTFKENVNYAYDGGVIIADHHYIEYMNIPGGENAYIDRIFIKLQYDADWKEVTKKINNIVVETTGKTIRESKTIYVRNTAQFIEGAEEEFKVINYVFLVILGGTVLIGLFGLVASAYASLIERKREIGIIRTLGLHGSETGKLFTIENIILLLSSATSGTLIGYFMALMMSQNMTSFTETPSSFSAPWNIIAILYGFSIIFLWFSMRIMMRKIKKKNLIEIFRETM